MGQDSAKGDGRADKRVELFVTADGELQVAGRDALDLQVFGGVAGEFEDFGRQVFEHGCYVDGSYVDRMISARVCGIRK